MPSQSTQADLSTRVATPADADAVGRLLYDFGRGFDEPSPSRDQLVRRMEQLLGEGQTAVVLGGAGPDGLAVMRFRQAIFSDGLECGLSELYVAESARGLGLGRKLMYAAMELARERGADHMVLDTSEENLVARALYESLGFSNRDGSEDGPVNYLYERKL